MVHDVFCVHLVLRCHDAALACPTRRNARFKAGAYTALHGKLWGEWHDPPGDGNTRMAVRLGLQSE
jgi:hypothetical protein